MMSWMHVHKRTCPAFTLVELIVGVLISAIIAGLAATSLSRLSRIENGVQGRLAAITSADAAADYLARDILHVVRDHELRFCRVVVSDGADGAHERDELLLLTRSFMPLRNGEPESAEREVQYRIAPDEEGEPALWRRADHALDRAMDAGGIACAVAPGVRELSVEAFDGAEWRESWDSDIDGLPHGVRAIVTAHRGGATVVARRVIALDRVPVVEEEPTP